MKKIRDVLLITNFISFFGYSLFAPLYAIFALQISPSVFSVAGSYSVYSIAMGLSFLIFGNVINGNKNKHKIVIFGYFLLACASFAFLFVNNLSQLIIVLVLNACGSGLVTPTWKALYSKNEYKGKETKEWAFFDGGNMIVAGIATFIGGYIANTYGFRVLFVAMGIVQMCGAVYSLKLLKTHEKK